MDIVEIVTDEQLKEVFPLIKELRSHLTEEEFLQYVNEMRPCGYKIIALRNKDEFVSAAGFGILKNLYYLKHLWVYEIVTTENARSTGYGKKLLKYLEDYAKKEGCLCIALSSGNNRLDAHRFYDEKMNYKKVSSVFKKEL